MGVWDAVKNITKKVVSDVSIRAEDLASSNHINRNITDEYDILRNPQKKIWVFNSGLNFSGNPKWLFIYINKYRPDIKAFWLCTEADTVSYINSLGYKAFLFSSKEGLNIATAAGVYVTEQCKEIIPPELQDCICLNLYHGVGCKSIERKVDYGFLFQRIMKKYVVNNSYYLNNQLFLVTSPLMEEHFKNQVGVPEDMVVRAGYPRCLYQMYYDKVQSFDHDILKAKNRDADTKIVVYAPTYRDNPGFNFVATLLPDMKALEDKLREANKLLVFKLHPLMQNDEGFKAIYEKYADSPYFLFWDNKNDIYEIIDRIDTAIIDYSSIFYDFLAGGVKSFIRYFADYGSADLRDNVFDYKEMTCGRICESFNDLLDAIGSTEADEDEEKERQRIYDLFWQYSSESSMEEIIEATLNFEPKKDVHPNLYSFDIFDTLISRKGLHPHSIFSYVKEQMKKSDLGFERHFIDSYITIRNKCEMNVREYRQKTTYVRNSDCREISFDSIFERISAVYNLTEEQITFLKETELEAEFNDCIPVPEMIAYAERLIDNGEDVILISDMYLSSAFIKRMLGKFSTKLTEIPMYVSSEYGVQKSTSLLYQEVYKDIDFYKYGKWIHHGDNGGADRAKPLSLGITPVRHIAPSFNEFENALVDELKTYDSYLVAAMLARFRERNKSTVDYFSYAYASLCIVSYTLWVLEDAQKRNVDTLYFIARDGYFPVQIAEQVIRKLDLKIKIKYIYGSRKVWRLPSFIDEIDESFFLPFGNLATCANYDELLSTLFLSKEEFRKMFPSLSELEEGSIITKDQMSKIIEIVKASDEFREHLLAIAAKERVDVEKYLRQEIDLNENFAFLDCWGRGYTQTCLTRLLHNMKKEKFNVPFYYVRSIYPSEGYDIRYNCSCKNHAMIFVEALFSTNINYKSVEAYRENADGVMVPVIESIDCKQELLDSMNLRLCSFVNDFLDLELVDKASTIRALFDYSLDYFEYHQDDPVIVENLADLQYSVTMYGMRDYAPKLTKQDVDLLAEKKVLQIHLTNSLTMSLARSDKEVVDYYYYMTEQKKEETKAEKKNAKLQKQKIIKDYQSKKYNLAFDVSMRKERDAYNEAAKAPVEDRIVIINIYDKPEIEFASLISYYKSKGFEIDILPLLGTFKDENLHKIATARYVFMTNISGWWSKINFRKETKLVQLLREPFPLSGISQKILPEYSEEKIQHIRRIHDTVYSLVPCTGEGVEAVLHENFVRRENCKKTRILGNPLTDVYFSEEHKKGIREKLSAILPDDGKKLIVYLPNTTNGKRHSYNYLDLKALEERCSDEYNILIVSNKGDDMISIYTDRFDGFAYNGIDLVTQREAMAVADIIIGDCTSTFAESVLTGKPVFLTSKYVPADNGTAVFTEDELFLAPLIEDSCAFADALSKISAYDFGKSDAFRKKFLGGCDGRSTEKIAEFLESNPDL